MHGFWFQVYKSGIKRSILRIYEFHLSMALSIWDTELIHQISGIRLSRMYIPITEVACQVLERLNYNFFSGGAMPNDPRTLVP